MAKIDYRKLRNELFRRTERYAAGVRALYDQALADIAKEFANMEYDPSRVFSFDEAGKFDRVDEIMTRLESQIQQVVDKGIVAEFGNAYSGCNELIRQVVGKNMSAEVARAFMPRVASGNAAKVFIKANRAGNITASQRVWNGAALGQMETAVEEGLMEGMPAKRMAKLLEDYLNDPDSCFRRFRIKTGVDADGKSMYGRKWKKRIIHEDGSTTWKDADPRDYPVGSGVYHSSYRNALRYARTTTNIAYRTADHDRYQDLPFVIGIEIKTSGNHPESDICDELAGEYPKDFLWVGWHPNCRCFQVPILAKPDEVEEMAEAIMEGDSPDDIPTADAVLELPQKFKDWLNKNERRIAEAKSLPYFLRDNGRIHNGHFYPRLELKQNEKMWSRLKETHEIMNVTFNGDPVKIFMSNPIYRFGITRFERELSEVFSRFGDSIDGRKLIISSNSVQLEITTEKGITLSRSFFREEGLNVVNHDLLEMPKDMQGQGLSKELLKTMFLRYKRTGIDKVKLSSNIDVGGYAWARYGFTFKEGKKWLINMIKSQGETHHIEFKEAIEIVEKWYKKNHLSDPFPMNLLTGYNWSKELLLGSYWEAELKLDDFIQIDVFNRYLGI